MAAIGETKNIPKAITSLTGLLVGTISKAIANNGENTVAISKIENTLFIGDILHSVCNKCKKEGDTNTTYSWHHYDIAIFRSTL